MNEALKQLEAEGLELKQNHSAQLSPLDFKQIKFINKYHFDLTESLKQGKFRPFKTIQGKISFLPQFSFQF